MLNRKAFFLCPNAPLSIIPILYENYYMEYQPQIIEAKRIGINENDVMSCENITQLLYWQIEVSKDISNISAQLVRNDYNAKKEGGEVDPLWKIKAQTSMELLKIFVQKINIRVMELKNKKTKVAEAFVETARKQLDADVFQDILIKSQEVK